jgi:type IV secretion system protein VirB8
LFKKQSDKTETDVKSWYKDKYEFVRSQRDLFALITLVSLLCSAAAVAAVMWLTPYKSVEPYLIQIDQTSGIVKRVDPVTRDQYTANEAIDRYFIAQYIRARENYHPAVFQQNYNLVRVMSTRDVFVSYARGVREANPDSPVATIGKFGQRDVKFKNITFISTASDFRAEKIAQARILMTDTFSVSRGDRVMHSIVTVKFQYSNLTLSQEERYLNPIGFLVTAYTIEREVV